MKNEKRLIDANALYKAIEEASKGAGFYRAIYDGFLNCIDRSPTVDAVEVVRCKDCKYSYSFPPQYNPTYCEREIQEFMSSHAPVVSEDHFCSYGERRADNG